MKIRVYQPTDKEKVLHLLELNTPEYFAPQEKEDLIFYLDQEIENYFIAEINGDIVGCGGFNLTPDKLTAKISWDIIHPDYQRKGVGSVLIRFRIEKIKEIESVKVISVRTSQLAYRFYHKFGLKLREIVKDYWAPGFDLYRLDNKIELIKS